MRPVCGNRALSPSAATGSNGTTPLASALNRELGGLNPQGKAMIAFIQRLSIHYDIYRRYPLPRIPALRNAWRIARA
jgi:hypothetical protein